MVRSVLLRSCLPTLSGPPAAPLPLSEQVDTVEVAPEKPRTALWSALQQMHLLDYSPPIAVPLRHLLDGEQRQQLLDLLHELDAKGVHIKKESRWRKRHFQDLTPRQAHDYLMKHPAALKRPLLVSSSANQDPYPMFRLADIQLLDCMHLGGSAVGISNPPVLEALRALSNRGFTVNANRDMPAILGFEAYAGATLDRMAAYPLTCGVRHWYRNGYLEGPHGADSTTNGVGVRLYEYGAERQVVELERHLQALDDLPKNAGCTFVTKHLWFKQLTGGPPHSLLTNLHSVPFEKRPMLVTRAEGFPFVIDADMVDKPDEIRSREAEVLRQHADHFSGRFPEKYASDFFRIVYLDCPKFAHEPATRALATLLDSAIRGGESEPLVAARSDLAMVERALPSIFDARYQMKDHPRPIPARDDLLQPAVDLLAEMRGHTPNATNMFVGVYRQMEHFGRQFQDELRAPLMQMLDGLRPKDIESAVTWLLRGANRQLPLVEGKPVLRYLLGRVPDDGDIAGALNTFRSLYRGQKNPQEITQRFVRLRDTLATIGQEESTLQIMDKVPEGDRESAFLEHLVLEKDADRALVRLHQAEQRKGLSVLREAAAVTLGGIRVHRNQQ